MAGQKVLKRRLKHKYGAKPCEKDFIKFPSQLERDCYLVLKQLVLANQILFFLRQIPFDLPGGYLHKVDFCLFTHDNAILIEAKGRDLITGRMKRKQVEDLYNLEIFVVNQAKDILKVLNEYGK